VFDACRNNPFERSGTRAVAGGGGLAPMSQLPEGVFSVFSAGYKQTALDRLSNDDHSPNSVFTRTFARELLQPRENLVEVAQHTRKLVSEMDATIGHRRISAYTDQMLDNLFLDGAAKGQAEAAKPAEPASQKVAALPPAVPRTAPPSESVNASIAAISRHSGGWPSCSRSPIPRSAFPGASASGRFPRDRLPRYARSAHPQAHAKSVDRACRRRPGCNDPTPLPGCFGRDAGAVPHQIRS
jgi:hypothetical protein